MIERLNFILHQECHLVPNQLLIVGVSGGADSLFLLDVLSRSDFSIAVAHYNHGLRLDADLDARFVEKQAQTRGLPFYFQEGDVRKFADSQSMSIEEAARELRYRFLFSQAERVNAQAVLVGHTANDQVETVLMHIFRGSGLAGLKGILPVLVTTPWSANIPLVRPLLTMWRDEIVEYLADQGIEPVFDASNSDLGFLRNRIRNVLIPDLRTYNPAIEKNIIQMADILRGDFEILEKHVEDIWDEGLVEMNPGYISYRGDWLAAQPVGLQRQLIRKGIGIIRKATRDMDFNMVERAVKFINLPTQSGALSLARGISIRLQYDKILLLDDSINVLAGNWPQLIPGEQLELNVPGTLPLEAGWTIHAAYSIGDVGVIKCKVEDNTDPFQAWIDADKVRLPLQIRGRLPGDRFVPLGMDGRSQKMSDLMVNKKLPAKARTNWPLIISASDIIWVTGLQLGHDVRLTENTHNVIHLRLRRELGG
jgi:tRNA(Ile)-lysidine synthase